VVGLLGADAGRQVEAGCNGSNYDEVGKTFELTGRQVRNRIRIIRPIAEKRDQKGCLTPIWQRRGGGHR